MDFCWEILYLRLPDLLSQFISRSLQGKDAPSEGTTERGATIFISYYEGTRNTIARVQKISAFLRRKGHKVFCYADEPVGINRVTYMQKATESDLIIILGTKNYKSSSQVIDNQQRDSRNTLFETLIFSQMFIQNNSDRIIPVVFERGSSFDESFPPPFNSNKGLLCPSVTETFLVNLEESIAKKMEVFDNV